MATQAYKVYVYDDAHIACVKEWVHDSTHENIEDAEIRAKEIVENKYHQLYGKHILNIYTEPSNDLAKAYFGLDNDDMWVSKIEVVKN